MDKPYCFGSYSEFTCACNECPAVEGCIKQLVINNTEYEKRKRKREKMIIAPIAEKMGLR